MLYFFERFVKLLTVLKATNKSIVAVFDKTFSVASTEIVHNLKKYCPHLNTIIDVGANKGQFASAIASVYPSAKIYSFEPLSDQYSLLQKKCATNENFKSFNIALGSSTGIIEFYKTNYSLASSALKPSDFHDRNTEYSTKSELIQVPVKRLDDSELTIQYSNLTLLKLDVQGFEKEVLKGATNILDKIDYILIEVSFVKMYEGEPLFIEMNNFLNTLGFSLLAPLSAYQNSSLRVLQLDLLYEKS